MKRASKKRGRPALPPTQGKRAPLNTRTTLQLRDKVAEASKETGRSLAQEVELRLEQSFKSDDAINAAFGGKELASLFRLLGAAAEQVELKTGKSWRTDLDTFVAMRLAWAQLLDQALNNWAPAPSPELLEAFRAALVIAASKQPAQPRPHPVELEETLYTRSPLAKALANFEQRFSSVADARAAEQEWRQWEANGAEIVQRLRGPIDQLSRLVAIGNEAANSVLAEGATKQP